MKKCFVVCPIGKDGSAVRKNADDLLELVIQPALQPFDFETVRADLIPRPSVITADIIQLVQTAELCIIDLTNSNPNVFYECGRRHETGKPFIQLIKKGEAMPFDVAGIRTIQYELSSPRSVHRAVCDIQAYVKEMSASGFDAPATGVSLSTIATALDRIERRLSQSPSRLTDMALSGAESQGEDILKRIRFEANPRKAFMDAYLNKDWRTAYALLPVLREKLGKTGEVVVSASIFASEGDAKAADMVKEILLAPDDTIKTDSVKQGVSALVDYYCITDQVSDGVPLVQKIVMQAVKRKGVQPKDEAFLLNQLQKLSYAAGQFRKALPNARRVLQLCPNDTAYMFNLSLLLDKDGKYTEAAKLVDRYMAAHRAQHTEHIDHLMNAASIYARVKRPKDADAALARVSAINPLKAQYLLREDETLRKSLGQVNEAR